MFKNITLMLSSFILSLSFVAAAPANAGGFGTAIAVNGNTYCYATDDNGSILVGQSPVDPSWCNGGLMTQMATGYGTAMGADGYLHCFPIYGNSGVILPGTSSVSSDVCAQNHNNGQYAQPQQERPQQREVRRNQQTPPRRHR